MSNIIVGWIKTAFLEIIQDPTVTKWIDDRLSAAIGAGEGAIVTDIKTEIGAIAENLEATLLTKLDALPAKLIGAAEKTIMDIVPGVGEIVGAVKTDVVPMFPTLDANTVAQLVISAIKGIIPFPFGEERK